MKKYCLVVCRKECNKYLCHHLLSSVLHFRCLPQTYLRWYHLEHLLRHLYLLHNLLDVMTENLLLLLREKRKRISPRRQLGQLLHLLLMWHHLLQMMLLLHRESIIITFQLNGDFTWVFVISVLIGWPIYAILYVFVFMYKLASLFLVDLICLL